MGAVNIDDEAFHSQLVQWVESDVLPTDWQQGSAADSLTPPTAAEAEADALFQQAVALLQNDQRAKAIAVLKEAFRRDPANWLIRKQLWAVETPDAFYKGPVDYGWQKEQMEREAAELTE